MTPQDPEPETDPELTRLLQEWSVPGVPDTLDARVKALFRERAPRRSLWQHFSSTSIRVPLPVAVGVLAAVLLILFWKQPPVNETESAESPSPTRAARYETQPGMAGSLAGFEPVREMNVTVLPESAAP